MSRSRTDDPRPRADLGFYAHPSPVRQRKGRVGGIAGYYQDERPRTDKPVATNLFNAGLLPSPYSPVVFANSREAQIGEPPHLAPPPHHRVENQAAEETQSRKNDQTGD